MMDRIEEGYLVFLGDGREGVGAVRQVTRKGLVVYVENAGEFVLPLAAVSNVHFEKVMLDPKLLDEKFLAAVRHAHDREDPNVAG